MRAMWTAWLLCFFLGGCVSSHAPAASDSELEKIRAVHGGAGPWVVAGYRMGSYALQELGLPRGSFDVEIVHYSPPEVQYSCIADGAAAATGASLGKLNLSRVDAVQSETHTRYRNRTSGRTLTLRLVASFVERFSDVPREQLAAKGREVLKLPDASVFEVVPDAP